MSYVRLLPAFALMITLGVASCQSMAGRDASAASGCQVTHVFDGDTVAMDCPGLGEFRARLTGYDTPEAFEPGCPEESALARAATDRLRALLATASAVEPGLAGTDRYGRRLVALRLDGRDVSATLISEGLAVPYSGGPRIDWCAGRA